MIRLATTSDAAAMLQIYAPFILNTTVTFEYEVPSEQDFQMRIQQYLEKWPWLVWVENGEVVGYAYASSYRPREAYQWCVECSVYIHPQFSKLGIATKLYSALIKLLKFQGFCCLYAVIDIPNPASVGFHEKMGFQYFATYENVGYKLGQWRNVGWWKYTLAEPTNNPSKPKFLKEIDSLKIQQILEADMDKGI